MFKKVLIWGTVIMLGVTSVYFAGSMILGSAVGNPATPIKISLDDMLTKDGTELTSVNGNLTRTYNGKEFSLSLSFKDDEGDTVNLASNQYEIKYFENDVPMMSAPVDAGTYSFQINITDSKYSGSLSGKIEITKKPLMIEFDNYDTDFNIVEIEDSNNFTYRILNDELDVTSEIEHDVLFDGSADFPQDEPGFHTVVVTINERNFSGSETVELLFTPEGSIYFDRNMTTVYSGEPYNLGVSTKGNLILENVVVTYKLQSSEDEPSTEAPTNVGVYEVVATFQVEINGVLEDYPSLEGILTINRLDIGTLSLSAPGMIIDADDANVESMIAGAGAQQAVAEPTLPAFIQNYTMTVKDCFGQTMLNNNIVYGGPYTIVIDAGNSNENCFGIANIPFDATLTIENPVLAYLYGEYYFENIAAHYEAKMEDGNVKPSMGSAQSTSKIKRKSTITDNFICQSITSGEIIDIKLVGIYNDPNEGMQVYRDSNGISYRHVIGKANVMSIYAAAFDTKDWTNTTEQDFVTDYIDYPEKFTMLVINESTINPTHADTKFVQGDNGERVLTFGFTNLNNVGAIYKARIQKNLDGQTFDKFNGLKPKYTIDRYGRIIKSEANESYNLKQGSFITVTITLTSTEYIDYTWNKAIDKNSTIIF